MKEKRNRLDVDLGESGEKFRKFCEAKGVKAGAEIRRLVEESLTPKTEVNRPRFKSKPMPDQTRVRREIRISKSELEAGVVMADFYGVNFQNMVLALIRSAAETSVSYRSSELEALAKASYELNAAGKNLNQLVKRLNADFNPIPSNYMETVQAAMIVLAQIQVQNKANSKLQVSARERWQLILGGALND